MQNKQTNHQTLNNKNKNRDVFLFALRVEKALPNLWAEANDAKENTDKCHFIKMENIGKSK